MKVVPNVRTAMWPMLLRSGGNDRCGGRCSGRSSSRRRRGLLDLLRLFSDSCGGGDLSCSGRSGSGLGGEITSGRDLGCNGRCGVIGLCCLSLAEMKAVSKAVVNVALPWQWRELTSAEGASSASFLPFSLLGEMSPKTRADKRRASFASFFGSFSFLSAFFSAAGSSILTPSADVEAAGAASVSAAEERVCQFSY